MQEVKHYDLRSINSLILFGIMKDFDVNRSVVKYDMRNFM